MKKSLVKKKSTPKRGKLQVFYIVALCLILPLVALTPLLLYLSISNVLDNALPGDNVNPGVIVYQASVVLPEGQQGMIYELPKTGNSLVLNSSPVVSFTQKASGCNADTSGYAIVHSWQRKAPADSASSFKTFANVARNITAVYDTKYSLPTTESGLDSSFQYRIKYLIYRIDSKGNLSYMNTITSDTFQPDANGHGYVGPVISLECQ